MGFGLIMLLMLSPPLPLAPPHHHHHHHHHHQIHFPPLPPSPPPPPSLLPPLSPSPPPLPLPIILIPSPSPPKKKTKDVIFPSPPPYEDQVTGLGAALLLAIVVTTEVIAVVTAVGIAVYWIHTIISRWKLEHRYPAAPVAPAVAPIARAKVVPYDSESIV
ncbi:hypothetical protein P8452_49933 [Trifolium repens]|nr:hypothetical protein P8452_49933 [Trifolium repens]